MAGHRDSSNRLKQSRNHDRNLRAPVGWQLHSLLDCFICIRAPFTVNGPCGRPVRSGDLLHARTLVKYPVFNDRIVSLLGKLPILFGPGDSLPNPSLLMVAHPLAKLVANFPFSPFAVAKIFCARIRLCFISCPTIDVRNLPPSFTSAPTQYGACLNA